MSSRKKLLALEDLKGLTSTAIKAHIASQYGGKVSGFDYGSPTEDDEKELAKELRGYTLLIAYESVGSWGCDSSSFFLLEKDGKLYENHGWHCSCYGFEGQWEPEETTKEALLARGYFPTGGYDESGGENEKAIRAYIDAL